MLFFVLGFRDRRLLFSVNSKKRGVFVGLRAFSVFPRAFSVYFGPTVAGFVGFCPVSVGSMPGPVS